MCFPTKELDTSLQVRIIQERSLTSHVLSIYYSSLNNGAGHISTGEDSYRREALQVTCMAVSTFELDTSLYVRTHTGEKPYKFTSHKNKTAFILHAV